MPADFKVIHRIDEELRSRGPDAAIAMLANRQHGVVGRTQLMDLGIGRGAIDRRIRRGRLHRIHRGAYSVGHLVISKQGRLMAAVLAVSSRAVLSHRCAASHWGLITAVDRVDVTTAKRVPSRPAFRTHFRALPADETTEHDGIPVTTVPRTLLDLASVVTVPQLRRAFEQADVLRLYDRLSVPELADRYPNVRGSRAIATVLSERIIALITRDDLEKRFLCFLDEWGLPRPQTNVRVQLAHEAIELDSAWPSSKLIVELDGFATHGTRARFESDRARDRMLQARGWRTVRVTWRQLHDQPLDLRTDLARLLAATR